MSATKVPRPMIIVAEEDSDSESEGFISAPLQPSNGLVTNSSLSTIDDSQFSHLGATQHSTMDSFRGGLASRKDLEMPPNEFAEGCKLLQAAALGQRLTMEAILKKRPRFVHFRDYDRRTALHVAASEGHIEICKFLIERGARVNRSDRWGGSPLDDASRHRHKELVTFLRSLGATTGSASKLTQFIKAAADGDVDEVEMLLSSGDIDVNEGDYDKRTALHLAAGNGHADIVQLLCRYEANVNIEDRWGNRPLNDAMQSKNDDVVRLLQGLGATMRARRQSIDNSTSRRREISNMEVKFSDLEMVDRLGKGSFGEIYKCRWRDIMVAAKCIRTAKLQKEWAIKQALNQLEGGVDPDAVISEIDNLELAEEEKEKALADFRTEISILKALRHPNIVLLLAYSTTADLEVMISELMRCSLLDIFKAHIINGTKMKKKDQFAYALQLAQGMHYLHTCDPVVIHRDLKPANLLIDHSGVLKVADFGLSKIRPNKTNKEIDTFMMTGETGSYRFMAPEIYKHESYNETVDVYSYGMILFYLLDGKPPWPTLNGLIAARLAAEEGDRPPIPRSWDNKVQTVLQECWDENPSARPSFHRILQALRQHARQSFITSDSSVNLHASSPDAIVEKMNRKLQKSERNLMGVGGNGPNCHGCAIM